MSKIRAGTNETESQHQQPPDGPAKRQGKCGLQARGLSGSGGPARGKGQLCQELFV